MNKNYFLTFIFFCIFSLVHAEENNDIQINSSDLIPLDDSSLIKPDASLIETEIKDTSNSISGGDIEREEIQKEINENEKAFENKDLNKVIESKPENQLPSRENDEEQFTAAEKRLRERRIKFNFVNQDLTKIINLVASKLKQNVILPQGALAITQKINFKQPKKISLGQAEKYLALFLDLAGYSMHKQNKFYVIVKNEQISREALPLYINISPEELPKIDERIRAVFYLSNLKVPEMNQGPLQSDPLIILLRESLSPYGTFIFDTKSNGIIITDKATNIAAVMKIIIELDNYGSKEIIEILPLYNSSARIVAEVLNKQILAVGDTRTIVRADAKSESGSYFSSNVRVLPYDEANKLIIIGRETAVNRIKDFVQEYMDTPPESGKSVLHAYDLQYLSAAEFAEVLKRVVNPRGIGTGQSQKEITGPTVFFEGVKIVAESYKAVESAKTIEGGTEVLAEGSVIRGGNRLIIAARERDWKQIKALIQDLDKPQRQVILEVLIADISLIDSKILGSQIRNPSIINLPQGVNFQSAQLIGPVTDETKSSPPTTLAADLLRLLIGTDPATSMATFLTSPITGNPGSFILSLNDTNGSGIWGVLQILQSLTAVKILSHPYIVTLNNFRAQEVVSEIRRVRGDQSIGEGGISSARQDDVEAALKVAITPRISSVDRLNLQITINIEQFTTIDPNNANRNTRLIQTNANLTTGQVLVLGGLTRLQETENETGLPILGQIPIIGWLFRNNAKIVTQTNLAVFISPTIVEPKIREGQDLYTKDKIKDSYKDMSEGVIFDNLRDPITRWFFKNGMDADVQLTNDYFEDIHYNTQIFDVDDKQLALSRAKPPSSDEEDTRKLQSLIAQEKEKDVIAQNINEQQRLLTTQPNQIATAL